MDGVDYNENSFKMMDDELIALHTNIDLYIYMRTTFLI